MNFGSTLLRAPQVLGMAAAIALTCTTAQAAIITTLFDGDATAEFAQWDSYTGTYSSTHVPTSQSMDNISLTPSVLVPGFEPPPSIGEDGGLLYSGSAITRYTFNSTYGGFDLGSNPAKTLVLQLESTEDLAGVQLVYGGQTLTAEFAGQTAAGFYGWQFDLTSAPGAFTSTDFTIVANNTTNHNGLRGARVDISRVQYTGTMLVPEPSAALMGLIAVTGIILRRRRR